jgi:hypothetical protein
MGFRPGWGLESSGELFGRDTGGTGTRTYKAESQEDVKHAKTANRAAKRRMKHNVNKRRKMVEKEVLFPEGRPGEIEEQGSHFEANDD